MAAFLYLWNPTRDTWEDFRDAMYRINNDEAYLDRWSCGNRKQGISLGDTFFLMRTGVPDRGIVGFGQILATPDIVPHWDSEEAAKGATSLMTDVVFLGLDDIPILPLSVLRNTFPDFNWTPPGGGIRIPIEIEKRLKDQIKEKKNLDLSTPSASELAKFYEGRPRKITTVTYDRSSAARRLCLSKHGYDCSTCGINFGIKYGKLGDGFIEVHHLKPIADSNGEYEIDPIEDLRPVCANCHRMLHMRHPPISIEELQNIMKKHGDRS